MTSLRALIAGGGASILASGIVLLGIVPAIEGLPAQPEATATHASQAPKPDESASPIDELVSCESIIAAGARPPMKDSARISYKDEAAPSEFDGVLNDKGEPVTATSKLVVSPELTVSSYFTRLGCADDGKVWAVLVLGDDYELDVSDGRGNGASYTSMLDEDRSTFTLTALDGTEYEPTEVFVTGPAGLHAAVFEIPDDIEAGAVDATFVFASTLNLYYGSATLPESVEHTYQMTATPFKLDGKWGCSPGAEWC